MTTRTINRTLLEDPENGPLQAKETMLPMEAISLFLKDLFLPVVKHIGYKRRYRHLNHWHRHCCHRPKLTMTANGDPQSARETLCLLH